jgi:tyrosyl-tRNA synthetase
VARFHDAATARGARQNFVARYQKGQLPENIEKKAVEIDGASIAVAALLKLAGMAAGTSAANRLIEQGGVRMDGEKIGSVKAMVAAGSTHLFQVGKRDFAEITVTRRS